MTNLCTMLCGSCKKDREKKGEEPRKCTSFLFDQGEMFKKDEPVYLCPECDKHTIEDRERNIAKAA